MTEDIIKQNIEFAISKEKETAAYYRQGAQIIQSSEGKELFLDLASQEDLHQKKISALDLERIEKSNIKNVPDLKISENLPELKINPDMDYQAILTVALKNEEAAHTLYQGMADHSQDPVIKKLFLILANEESKHKLRLEEEYEREFLAEN